MRILFSLALMILLVSACTREAPEQRTVPTDSAIAAAAADWTAFGEAVMAARFNADPYFAVQSGRHEFDGQMPDWSRASIQADVASLREQLAQLRSFEAAPLTPAQRFERRYLEWVLESEIFWRADASAPFRNPAWYLERLDPSIYLARDYAPLSRRLAGFLGYLRAIPGITANIRGNLQVPLPLPFIERGSAGFGGYARFFRDEVPALIANLEEADLKREVGAASAVAARSMEDLAAWLESQRAAASGEFALGAETFSRMLRITGKVDLPLEDLEFAGRRDLERNLAALSAACGQFAPGKSLSVCVERMRANKPSGGSVEGARRQLAQLRQFVIDHRLVSIPTQVQALVAESPPYNRGNFAYISIPGPFESPAVKVTYYVAPPDDRWSAAERNAYLPGQAYLLFVSVHEVWPGHYLHSQHANANPSKIAGLWWDYAFGEGWAHYTEEMMYDAGLGRTQPELRVGMLSNALLRNVRYLSAICLHTGCMSLAESEAMFRTSAFADAGNARQQALRGTYDPGYLAYTLGKLMIRKLRTDWLAANPDATLQQFHDRFLSYGAPPIPLVREQMLGVAGAVL